MHVSRRSRLALVLAAATALALPGAAVAAPAPPVPSPAAPPPAVVDWQTHLAHMLALPGPIGADVVECVAMHGSLANQLGPNGAMFEMMGEMVR